MILPIVQSPNPKKAPNLQSIVQKWRKTNASHTLIEETKMKLWEPELRFVEVSKRKTVFSVYPFVYQKDFPFPLNRLLNYPFAQHPGGSQLATFKLTEAGMYRLFPQWSSIKEILTIIFLLIRILLSHKSYRLSSF